MNRFGGRYQFALLVLLGLLLAACGGGGGGGASTDATLSGLTLSSGRLSPVFATDVTTYGANNPVGTSSITVTPVTSSSVATVTVNGTAVDSGTASGALALNLGNTDITIVVTAADTITQQTYTLTAFRGFHADAYIKASNSGSGDEFGAAIAVSGNTIVVGAHLEDSSTNAIINGSDLSSTNDLGTDVGAAYVFVRGGDENWTQQAYLKAPNAGDGDDFGKGVAISGDTIAVGALLEDSSTTAIINGSDLSSTNNTGTDVGAVYVFVRDGAGSWSHQAYLKAPNAEGGDDFARRLDISGDTIVVGARLENSSTNAIISGSDLSSTNNTGINPGAAYVFVRSGTTWSHQAYLKAPNAGDNDEFGISLAISGDTIVVGGFQEDAPTNAIINGSDLSGLPADNSNNDANGAAYVFLRSGATWNLQAYLKAPNAGILDKFAEFVDIDGDTIVVGTPREDSASTAVIDGSDLSGLAADSGLADEVGAAYVFVRSGSTWSHQAYLKAPNAEISDQFGMRVAISGDTILAGTFREDSTSNAIVSGSDLSGLSPDASTLDDVGAVYLFTRTGSTWSHGAYLKAPNAGIGDNLAESVAIDGDIIVSGAPLEDSSQTTITNGDTASSDDSAASAGAVYILR